MEKRLADVMMFTSCPSTPCSIISGNTWIANIICTIRLPAQRFGDAVLHVYQRLDDAVGQF